MGTDANLDADDELLGEFINESREHLRTIEADLLAIEESGANIDVELVNKVFRAAHSIKGASGYFGLMNVKELAHQTETVLDRVRSRKLVPDAEVVNLLLAAFDRLREMIHDPAASHTVDISELDDALSRLASSPLPEEKAAPSAPVATPPESVASLPASPLPSSDAGVRPAPGAAAKEDSIRVNVTTLDTLMNLAGELVLGRNQLRASIAQKNARGLKAADQRINQITTELQDVVMQTRLQPMGTVFGRFPRLVRDLSASLHKEIHLEIHGRDVALDRSLIESLADPLTHMVRNAIDHAIELPEDRIACGKSRHGLVSIGARHEAGQVVVEITDDGRGIDHERIAKVALAKELITAEKLDGMTAKDKLSLIFLPGLSTSSRVSDVSGRGVGMDVVKTNIDRLGGKVEILSSLGKGTTFRIKLPLTLAIIPSLIVSVDGERFAIPQINVEEMRHVLAGQSRTRVETVGDAEVLVLRDRLIPLVRFADVLGVLPTYIDPKTGKVEIDRRARMADRRASRGPHAEDGQNTQHRGGEKARRTGDRRQDARALEIVVVTTGTQTYGLVVDGFHDTEEIVVKPLGSHLKGLEEYAGATILGDGSVALILDIAGLAAKANLDAIAGRVRVGAEGREMERAASAEVHSLVLFHNPPDLLCGLPLDTVKRIEHIDAGQAERIGGRRTMQYNGGLLPLVTLSDVAAVEPIGDTHKLAVIIANIRGREVGLLGAMPVDVIETTAQVDSKTHRQKGVAGSTIIRGRTALIVDLYELVDTIWPAWTAAQQESEPRTANGPTVLLAEDSDFFRSQITRVLEEDGYTVLAAGDGEAAWEQLTANFERVRAVVTDIEMPRLDGMQLARRIRADQRTMRLPVIALTSLAGEEDIERGKAAGIDDYQTKLDREQLLTALHRYAAGAPDELQTRSAFTLA